MAKLCQVCATTESKYKCPTCRTPYCSAACYKAHKQAPCAPEAKPAASPASEHQQNATAASATPPQASSAPSSTAQPTPPGDDEMVDASQLLSIAQLDALRELPIVHQSMSNPAIREMLTKIDSSGDRMKELEKALLDQTFASFMYQALDAIDAK
ncbi:putative mynd zn-finger protein/hormone receptor interactor, partial [Globisporangium splendens]